MFYSMYNSFLTYNTIHGQVIHTVYTILFLYFAYDDYKYISDVDFKDLDVNSLEYQFYRDYLYDLEFRFLRYKVIIISIFLFSDNFLVFMFTGLCDFTLDQIKYSFLVVLPVFLYHTILPILFTRLLLKIFSYIYDIQYRNNKTIIFLKTWINIVIHVIFVITILITLNNWSIIMSLYLFIFSFYMFLPYYTNCNNLFMLFLYIFFYTFGLFCLSICLYSNKKLTTNFDFNSFFFKFILIISLIFISGIPPITTFFLKLLYLVYIGNNINFYTIYPILFLFLLFWYYIYNMIINIVFVDTYFNFFKLRVLKNFIFRLSFFVFVGLNFFILDDWIAIFSLFFVFLCF